MSTEMTDEDVLAELDEGEHVAANAERIGPAIIWMLLRRLALTRRQLREAEGAVLHLSWCQACADGPQCDEIASVVASIRARGGTGNG